MIHLVQDATLFQSHAHLFFPIFEDCFASLARNNASLGSEKPLTLPVEPLTGENPRKDSFSALAKTCFKSRGPKVGCQEQTPQEPGEHVRKVNLDLFLVVDAQSAWPESSSKSQNRSISTCHDNSVPCRRVLSKFVTGFGSFSPLKTFLSACLFQSQRQHSQIAIFGKQTENLPKTCPCI